MFTLEEVASAIWGHFVTIKNSEGELVHLLGPNAVLPDYLRSRLVAAVLPDSEPAGDIPAIIVIVE